VPVERRDIADDHAARSAPHGGIAGDQYGANVEAVQRMVAHAKASTTLDTYAVLFDTDLDAVAVDLDSAIRVNTNPLASTTRS
jgi:hypothetical protein